MAQYRVTAPDGTTYNVTGPEGATDEQVLAQVKAAHGGAGATQPKAATPAPAAPAAPAAAPSALPEQPEQSMMGFTLGNINKGIANLAGTPVDAITNALNLGIAGAGSIGGALGGARYMPEPIRRPFGGSESIQGLMQRGGMITPDAEPQNTWQRYLAAVLQMGPGAALGRPTMAQLPRALAATTTSGLASEAARDIGGDEWAGVGAMLPGAGKMQRPGAGARATATRQAESFGKARELGVPVPPSALKPDKAQQAIQNQGNKALRQPEGTEFSPATLKAYRDAHYGDYEAVIKSPALANGVVPTPAFQAEIQKIGNEIESARGALPETFKGMRPVLKLLSEYGYAQMPQGVGGGVQLPPRKQPIPPDVAMRAVKKLRDDASTNFSSDKPEKVEMAGVQKRLANSIEDMIEENLARTGDQGLMDKFKTARTAIARSHDYQAAMGPGGRIDAAKLAAMQNEGAPLTGGTEKIADVAGAFPSAVGKPKSDETFTKRVSPMAITHPPAVAAHQVPRFWEKGLMTGPGQAMIDPRNRLTPEQQQMIRYFSAINAQARARQNPTPPE